MPSEVVRTNRTLAKLLVAVSLVLLFHGPSQAQTSPKLTDFVGQWSGKWDDKLPARWTIGLAPGGKEAIMYYECKDKDAPFRGSWLVGKVENGLFKAGSLDLGLNGLFKVGFLDLRLDDKDKKMGKAVGRFKVAAQGPGAEARGFDIMTRRTDLTLDDASLPSGFGEAKTMLATKVNSGIQVATPLADFLAYLYYQSGVYTKVDEEAFKRAGIKNIASTVVTVPVTKDVIAESILEDMLEPIKATFRVENNVILIVPAKPQAKGK